MKRGVSVNFYFFHFCLFLLTVFVFHFSSAAGICASSHLWPLAALHFDAPSHETETFKMDPVVFEKRLTALNADLSAATEACKNALSGDSLFAFLSAQAAWQYCFDAFERVLKPQLDQPVKVFYGLPEKERKTNIYRDTVLTLLEQRTADLRRWHRGGWQRAEPYEQTVSQALIDADIAFHKNLYVMDEKFRNGHMAARAAWDVFYRENASFVLLVTEGDSRRLNSENLLQVLRIHDLTLLHVEGSVFFHRERED